MSKQEWTEFLRFAELQRVYLRTLRLLQKWSASGAFAPPFDDFHDLEQREKQQVEDALATLNNIVRALELTGHTPLVIKTLDHWPDIGSDLDLFISASQRDTVRAMRSELQAEPQPQSWGDRLAHKWNFQVPGQARSVEIHVGCLGQTGEQDELPGHPGRNKCGARCRAVSFSRSELRKSKSHSRPCKECIATSTFVSPILLNLTDTGAGRAVWISASLRASTQRWAHLAGSCDSAEDYFRLQRARGRWTAPSAGLCTALRPFRRRNNVCGKTVPAGAHAAAGFTVVFAATDRNGNSSPISLCGTFIALACAGRRGLCQSQIHGRR